MVTDDRDLRQRAARAEALLAEIESLPDPRSRATAVEAIQALAALYGEGLARFTAILAERDAELLAAVAADEWIGHLLVLHDLHPDPVEERVARALDEVRPQLHAHDGDVELIGIAGGMVQIRLQGSCGGCPSSTMSLKLAIEEAVRRHAPDLDGVADVGPAGQARGAPAGFIPLTALRKPSSSTVR